MGVLIATWVAATAAGSKSDLDNGSYLIRGLSQGAMGQTLSLCGMSCIGQLRYRKWCEVGGRVDGGVVSPQRSDDGKEGKIHRWNDAL